LAIAAGVGGSLSAMCFGRQCLQIREGALNPNPKAALAIASNPLKLDQEALERLRTSEAEGFLGSLVQHGRNAATSLAGYSLIYKARNDYLHGNPVNDDDLLVKDSKRFCWTTPRCFIGWR
jgi:hypothetical protein